MRLYKARKIEFTETVKFEDWSIKIYTITENKEFDHPEFYNHVKAKLPEWVLMQNSFDSSNHKVGFLILHEGKEGIFSIINWWVDENMMNTHIFLSDPNKPNDFTQISGDGLAPCNWEIEVIYHEKTAWVEHILKPNSYLNIPDYLNDTYNATI